MMNHYNQDKKNVISDNRDEDNDEDAMAPFEVSFDYDDDCDEMMEERVTSRRQEAAEADDDESSTVAAASLMVARSSSSIQHTSTSLLSPMSEQNFNEVMGRLMQVSSNTEASFSVPSPHESFRDQGEASSMIEQEDFSFGASVIGRERTKDFDYVSRMDEQGNSGAKEEQEKDTIIEKAFSSEGEESTAVDRSSKKRRGNDVSASRRDEHISDGNNNDPFAQMTPTTRSQGICSQVFRENKFHFDPDEIEFLDNKEEDISMETHDDDPYSTPTKKYHH